MLQSLPLGTGSMTSVSFSSDGRQIVVASGQTNAIVDGQARPTGWVKVCDASTGQKRLTIDTGSEAAYSAALSPDGDSLIAVVGAANFVEAAGKVNEVRVWDADTGRLRFTLQGHLRPLLATCYSPDGRRIAAGGYDPTVRIYAAADGREQLALRGHRGCVNQIAFSPDNRWIASTSDDGSAKIWDAESGEERATLRGHRAGFYAVAFSPDGRRLVTTGYDGTVKVWDATSSPEARTISASESRVCAVAFSPDGRRLVTAGFDRALEASRSPVGPAAGDVERSYGGRQERGVQSRWESRRVGGRRLASGRHGR